MHILLYNPVHYGHHLSHVRLMVRAFTPFASQVTFATTRRSASSPEYAEHLSDVSAQFTLDDSVDTVEMPEGRFSGLETARCAWRGLRGAVARNRPDYVLVGYGDHLVFGPLIMSRKERDLGIDRSRIHGIFLQCGEFAYRRHLGARRRVRSYAELNGFRRLNFGRNLFMDPIVLDWLRDHCPSLSSRCVRLPDPVSPVGRHDKSAARATLGLPTNGRLISCVGVLDVRKGIDEFIRSFTAAPLAETDRLLLAGRATPEVIAAVREVAPRIGEGRIICMDKILTGQEMELAISAADLVATTHRFPEHLGTASIPIRAAAAGRPVLATELGWLGDMTRNYALGWIYPTEQQRRPDSIAQSLKGSVDYLPGERAAEFVKFQSIDGFCQTLAAPFREAACHSPGSSTSESSDSSDRTESWTTAEPSDRPTVGAASSETIGSGNAF